MREKVGEAWRYVGSLFKCAAALFSKLESSMEFRERKRKSL